MHVVTPAPGRRPAARVRAGTLPWPSPVRLAAGAAIYAAALTHALIAAIHTFA